MYKAPLHIYVVWHPKSKTGSKFANQIYSRYTRNIEEPLSREGIGIPVFFRSVAHKNDLPKQIDLAEANRNAVLVLVDDQAIIHWKSYLAGLLKQVNASGKNNRFIPVSLSHNFSNIGAAINKINGVRIDPGIRYDEQQKALIPQLTHELCRMLYDKPRQSERTRQDYSPEPISLFISHAKLDGTEMAKEIKSAAEADTPIKTFFDAIDIAPGHKWPVELEANIESTALLVIQTDAYASREWCRWEVLKAKKSGRPVVVVNAVKEGEDRSFPYLGNVPTIRWKNTGSKSKLIKKILAFTLFEILRFHYTFQLLTTRPRLASITRVRIKQDQKILASPPELLTLLEKATEETTRGKIVLYPDPPLTAEEVELLNETTDDIDYLTPTMLAAYETAIEK